MCLIIKQGRHGNEYFCILQSLLEIRIKKSNSAYTLTNAVNCPIYGGTVPVKFLSDKFLTTTTGLSKTLTISLAVNK